jgi:hopanoid biosynthesis associated protein HpnK
MKRLIVNADDLGISPGTNRAIADCFARGIVTSASLLINMPAAEDALRVVREHPTLAVGLHVCLTSGRSVLPASEVPLLVDDTQALRHSFPSLAWLLRSRDRAAALTQLAAEIDAQAALAVRSGVTLNHLDSHQHVHMLPGLFAIVADVARRAGVPVRVSYEPCPTGSLAVGPSCLIQGASGLLKRSILATCARQIAPLATGLRRSDRCFGITHTGRMTREVLTHLIRRLPEGVTELITHPSLETDHSHRGALSDGDRGFLRSPRRRQEYDALLDPEIRQLVDRVGVQLDRPRTAA